MNKKNFRKEIGLIIGFDDNPDGVIWKLFTRLPIALLVLLLLSPILLFVYVKDLWVMHR